MDDKELKKKIRDYIDYSEDYYENEVEASLLLRNRIYDGDIEYYREKMPKLSRGNGVPDIVSTDVRDKIEWALASIMGIYFGSEAIFQVSGVTEEDAYNAEILTDIIEFQLTRQDSCYNTFYNWFKSALKDGYGIMKCYWERVERDVEEEIILEWSRLAELIEAGLVISWEKVDDYGNFKAVIKNTYLDKNKPVLKVVSPDNFIFYPLKYSDLSASPFVAEKQIMSKSDLLKMQQQGIYANVDKVVENTSKGTGADKLRNTALDDYLNNNIIEATSLIDEYLVYECYCELDLNEDGINEKWIITVCNDTILRIEENIYSRHPYFFATPIDDPNRIIPKKSFSDLCSQTQDIKTALTRMMMINTALNNDPRLVISEDSINVNDYVSGKNVIRKRGGSPIQECFATLPSIPLSPLTMSLMEYSDIMAENATGITRYNQGLDANSLNRTATGITAIMQASNKRLELMVRNMTETGVKDLGKFLVHLNTLFLDMETVKRITNKELKIRPDDVKGEFDVKISVNMGLSGKQANMMNLQQALTAVMQVSGAGYPIATPDNVYNLVKKWMVESGLTNVDKYLTEPAFVQMKMVQDQSIKLGVLQQLPPEIMSIYLQTGSLPPEILSQLPPYIQSVFGLPIMQMGGGVDYVGGSKNSTGNVGGSSVDVVTEMGGGGKPQDNRLPQAD